MPTRFDFISPGIQLNEVDESQIPSVVSDETGPVIVGRSLSGPAMKPVKVKSLQDFNEIFGLGISGKGNQNNDVWRDGNTLGPTYAVYAAQAHLASETTPVTFLRLLGEKSKDATSDSEYAGWNIADTSNPSATLANNKSAYGLFILSSGSSATGFNDQDVTGSLAAIFYVNGGGVRLKGTIAGSAATTSSCGTLIKSLGTSANRFEIEIMSSTDTVVTTKVVDFTPGSGKYIRNQFNTNPQQLEANKNFGLTDQNYFLGETFEESAFRFGGTSTTVGDQLGIILALDSGSLNFGDHKKDMLPAKTGWFLNRKTTAGEDGAKLFRLVSLHEGEWLQAGYQTAIKDLSLGNDITPNSTFTLEIQDKHGNAIEQFSGLNLDPSSESYISKAIGDQYLEWDETNAKYNVRGEYRNKSNYVYVEAASAVTSQQLADAHALPVGCLGPLRPKGFTLVSGSLLLPKGTEGVATLSSSNGIGFGNASVVGSTTVAYHSDTGHLLFDGQTHFAHLPASFTGSFVFPSLRLTTQNANSNGYSFHKTDFQGVRHNRSTANIRDESYIDLARVLPGNSTINISHHLAESAALPLSHEYSYIFSLSDIRQDTTDPNTYYYESGSYDAGTSYANSGGRSVKDLFNDKVRQFRSPFFGGHDGLNLKEVEPFSNKNLKDKTRKTSYAYNSIFKALESVEDPEVIDYNVLAIPGITQTDITDEVLRVANLRKDHLAIIDIEGGHKPAYETNGSVVNGDINGTITSLEGRKLNTSYAAAYYPWVRLRDRIGGQNDVLYVPPSVAAIGALAKSDKAADLWFAPAGFNRGGINELGGSTGPIITGTWEHLTKDDRDDLYRNNINPIARFPSMDQIVIFGQKTLQQSDSALNRINVRRLLIYLKQRIGLIAETILFDQNVNTTWNRFKFQAERVLTDVQNRLGISEFKLVLDEKTTTQDLVDRNIMYAKIFIKPTRSIEYIAVDFIISRSGVEF